MPPKKVSKPAPKKKPIGRKPAGRRAPALVKAGQTRQDESEYSRNRTIQMTYPDGDANPRTFRQYNPKNSNALCLYYAFARGYYGPPNVGKDAHPRARDNILPRMLRLWNHVSSAGPATQARLDRRVIYQEMQDNSATPNVNPGENEERLDWQRRTLNWGTMDAVQVLADTYDVEILVWVPARFHRNKPLDPAIPQQWTLMARGDRHLPERQIHLCNYQNISHWTLLVPNPVSETPNVLDNNDPHMNHPTVPSAALRTPMLNGVTIPQPLLRYPEGHSAYTTLDNPVPKDYFSMADIDTVIPDAQPFADMNGLTAGEHIPAKPASSQAGPEAGKKGEEESEDKKDGKDDEGGKDDKDGKESDKENDDRPTEQQVTEARELARTLRQMATQVIARANEATENWRRLAGAWSQGGTTTVTDFEGDPSDLIDVPSPIRIQTTTPMIVSSPQRHGEETSPSPPTTPTPAGPSIPVSAPARVGRPRRPRK